MFFVNLPGNQLGGPLRLACVVRAAKNQSLLILRPTRNKLESAGITDKLEVGQHT